MYYIFINNEKIIGSGQCRCLSEHITNIEVSEDIYNKCVESPNYYIVSEGQLVINPNFEREEMIKALEEENKELKEELDTLDLKAVRPLRAIAAGEATDADINKLSELEAEAQEIRAKIIANEAVINGGE